MMQFYSNNNVIIRQVNLIILSIIDQIKQALVKKPPGSAECSAHPGGFFGMESWLQIRLITIKSETGNGMTSKSCRPRITKSTPEGVLFAVFVIPEDSA